MEIWLKGFKYGEILTVQSEIVYLGYLYTNRNTIRNYCILGFQGFMDIKFSISEKWRKSAGFLNIAIHKVDKLREMRKRETVFKFGVYIVEEFNIL